MRSLGAQLCCARGASDNGDSVNAVFARNRAAAHQAMTVLRNAAGNFYVNDKPTGAVVGHQPFGGARLSRRIPGPLPNGGAI